MSACHYVEHRGGSLWAAILEFTFVALVAINFAIGKSLWYLYTRFLGLSLSLTLSFVGYAILVTQTALLVPLSFGAAVVLVLAGGACIRVAGQLAYHNRSAFRQAALVLTFQSQSLLEREINKPQRKTVLIQGEYTRER